MRLPRALLLATLIASFSITSQAQPQPSPKPQPKPQTVNFVGGWEAEIVAARPGVDDKYRVPFNLVIDRTSAGLTAALVNGHDRIAFNKIEHDGNTMTLRLDQYDAVLTLRCTQGIKVCSRLEGEYSRQRSTGISHYAVTATRMLHGEPMGQATLAPEWQFAFTGPDGKPASEPTAPGHFSVKADRVEGTIAPVSGDYGLLSGTLHNSELHLSRFDGIHLLRLDGKVVSPERIEGVFHVSPGNPLSFVATRTAAPEGFAEAEQLTHVEDSKALFHFHAEDASGVSITEADPRFQGKVVLLDLFGTWCPNCQDEAPLLQALYEKYHGRGLEVVGLSYEYINDRARSLRLIEIYRKKFGITFPLLLSGTTDAGDVERTLPQLKNFGAFPTTIFLDRHGRARLVHAGFSGPATGRFEEVRKSFERTLDELLNEP
jgi:thiol-disulfide isomerase/thioredoxin